MTAPTPRVPPGGARLLSLALIALVAGAPALDAQEPGPDDQGPVLMGTVVDAGSGAPLDQAMVSLESADWGVFTNEEGRFRLEGVAPGRAVLLAERIGYAERRIDIEITDDPEPVVVRLAPDPVMLKGFEVVTDRFERRRNATPTAVRAYDLEDLLRSPYISAAEFVEGRAGVPVVPCPSRVHAFHCVLVRGRVAEPSVYIDEAPALGGMDELDMYRPADLYMIEVYAQGRHIRAYTHSYMKHAARRQLWPVPLFF